MNIQLATPAIPDPTITAPPDVSGNDAQKNLDTTYKAYYDAKAAHTKDPADKGAETNLQKAQAELNTALQEQEKKNSQLVKKQVEYQAAATIDTTKTNIQKDTSDIQAKIDDLTKRINEFTKPTPPPPTAANTGATADDVVKANEGWVRIVTDVSSKTSDTEKSEEATSYSVSASVGYGLFSAGGSYGHKEANQKLSAKMASCDVHVELDVMRVDITREWLYGELFGDPDFSAATM